MPTWQLDDSYNMSFEDLHLGFSPECPSKYMACKCLPGLRSIVTAEPRQLCPSASLADKASKNGRCCAKS
eukprot:3401701-Amphidinium_carterae.1